MLNICRSCSYQVGSSNLVRSPCTGYLPLYCFTLAHARPQLELISFDTCNNVCIHTFVYINHVIQMYMFMHLALPSCILLAVLGLSVKVPGFSETNKLVGARYGPKSGNESWKQTWMRPPSHCSSLRLASCWDLREVTARQLLSNPEISSCTSWQFNQFNLLRCEEIRTKTSDETQKVIHHQRSCSCWWFRNQRLKRVKRALNK